MRGATVGPGDIPAIEKPFQSTHPMRGATSNTPRPPIDHGISIHAPHAGRDRCRRSDRRGKYYFNPRAPCGARPRRLIRPTPRPTLQSTRPVRGATLKPITANMIVEFQSTRPVRGATIASWPKRPNKADFNPRAPCGARQTGKKEGTTPKKFQSTRPVRGATRGQRGRVQHRRISIHAPRAGRDVRTSRTGMCLGHFNPRAPCGARLALGLGPSLSKNFNPRAPCGARPNDSAFNTHPFHFNPRAPCGARRRDSAGRYCGQHFNPRAPCGARHVLADLNDVRKDFNPRAPCGARRASIDDLRTVQRSFQSTRPVRGATSGCPAWYSSAWHFNPRAPCGARRAMTRTGTPSAGFQSTRPVRGATRSTRTAAPPCIFQSTRPVRGATWL